MARSPASETRAHVDVHVGKQLSRARVAQGLNQSEVARMLGLTFQQIQKYEKGTNRMSASVLWTLVEGMNLSVEYFFEGLGSKDGLTAEHKFATMGRPGIQMAELFAKLPKHRQQLLIELARDFVSGGEASSGAARAAPNP